MKLALLFSGGKDSNYALHLAKKFNHEIVVLLNMQSKNQNSYMFQSAANNLLKLQSQALNIPLQTHTTKGEKETELKDLKKAIKKIKDKHKIQGVLTGAIKSCYQSSRIQKICHDLNLKCLNPLWQKDENEYMKELLQNKFEIKIVGIFSYPLTQKWLGKTINKSTLAELKKLNKTYKLSIAGEGGEYESLITNAPTFSKKIILEKSTAQMDSENSGVLITEKASLKIKTKKENQTQKPLSIKQSENLQDKKILIIDLNEEKNSLFELEYINPILNAIPKTHQKNTQIIHHKDLKKNLLQKPNKIKAIILSGNPLKAKIPNHEKFKYLKNTKIPLLAICAGAQLISKLHEEKLIKHLEVGLQNPTILKQDPILKNEKLKEIYSLHTKSFKAPKEFQTILQTNTPQLLKKDNTYLCLFHPEVRNKQLIKNFINNALKNQT